MSLQTITPSETGAPPAEQTALTKAALRSLYQERRSKLEGREALSAQICRRLQSLPEITGARTVHVYWPMVHRAEVDLRPFIHWLAGRGTRVAMPVLTPEEPRRISSRLFTGEEDLVQNAWGVSEPLHGLRVPEAEMDAVIVPALVVGQDGYRIGYGKGHYDVFLQDLDVPRVCPIYAACVAPSVPFQPHDVPLTVIVTENEVIRPGGL